MKKVLLLIILLLFPMVVFADDETYFVVYPDYYEYGTLSRSEADSAENRLMYSGVTNSNGEVIITDWAPSGEIIIEEEVPEGYTTTQSRISMDLNQGEATFVNMKEISNPVTGHIFRCFLFSLLGLIFLTIIVILMVKKKNVVTVMGFLFVFLGIIFYSGMIVHAEDGFVITVKDGSGKRMGNVPIKVYGSPVRVDSSPSIKVDANGGHFFDGRDVMYFRFPNNTSSLGFCDYLDSLPSEQVDYFVMNRDFAYRDGYRVILPEVACEDLVDSDFVYTINWNQDDSNLFELDGNGGVMNFFGTFLSKVYINPRITENLEKTIRNYLADFKNKAYFNIGYDNNPDCSHYNESGFSDEAIMTTDKAYVCWQEKPDGIYLNDTLFFKGNIAECFRMKDESDDYKILFDGKNTNLILKSLEESTFEIALVKRTFSSDTEVGSASNEGFNDKEDEIDPRIIMDDNVSFIPQYRQDNMIEIHKLEVIYNHEVFLLLEDDDIELKNENAYRITNSQNNKKLLDYVKRTHHCDMCLNWNSVVCGASCNPFTGEIHYSPCGGGGWASNA